MDIVDNCRAILNEQLISLDGFINQHVNPIELQQTQTKVDSALRDKNNDLDLILEQQTHVKGLIEKDERVISLRRQIREDKRTIDDIRRSCSKIAADSLRSRQLLEVEQGRELEKFQLQLMRNIIDDQARYTRILAQRDQELNKMKADYENEERNRPTVLENIKKNLERSLEERRRHLENGRISSHNVANGRNVTTDRTDPDNIELMTIDEYVPNNGKSNNAQATGPKKRGRGGATGARGGTRGRSTRGRRGSGRGAHAA